MTIELNADLAEGFEHDDEILSLVQRANICLGAHAGSVDLALQTVAKCQALGIAIAAHPGYPDRDHFGRRTLSEAGMRPDALYESVMTQLSHILPHCDSIKPHGAFYNDSTEPGPVADLLVEVLREAGRALIGLPGTYHESSADRAGVTFIAEGFADRGYTPNGRLIPRDQPGAILQDNQMDEAISALLTRVKTLCVHGDGDDPVGRLMVLRALLERKGIKLRRCE